MIHLVKIAKIILSFILLISLSGCLSKTLIKTVPPRAKVYINDELKGETPYLYSDTKISGSETALRIEKHGYEAFSTKLKRNENVHGGAVFAGIIFGFWPFLWTMEYNPERTYELKRDLNVNILADDTFESSNNMILQTPENEEKNSVSSLEYQKVLKLKELYDSKIITAEEYESEKNKILDFYGKYGSPTRSLDSKKYAKLKELKSLLDQGAINEEDFNNAKRDIVGESFYKFYKKKEKK